VSEAPRVPHSPHVRKVAEPFLARGDAVGWFEAFYREQEGDETRVPWADREGHPLLGEWIARHGPGRGRAAVVGCGLGEEAERLAAAGWSVLAFDVAPTAIAWAKRRFPESRVDYRTANLLALPEEWRGTFDLVVEVATLQALEAATRARAFEPIAGLLARGGALLVIARGREAEDPVEGVPWPLTRAELGTFERLGLSLERLEDLWVEGERGGRHFRALFRRA
jgi:SAM-dependent methyltransferase